jgi:hypothetical protein
LHRIIPAVFYIAFGVFLFASSNVGDRRWYGAVVIVSSGVALMACWAISRTQKQ